jgi:ankyrin
MSRRLLCAGTVATFLAVVPAARAAGPPPVKLPGANVPALIDRLTHVTDGEVVEGEPGAGFLFLPLDHVRPSPAGPFGRKRLLLSQTLREIVKQGVAAVPHLLEHLDDCRPTRVTPAAANLIGGEWYSAERDFNRRTESQPAAIKDDVEGPYIPPDGGARKGRTLAVGELCYLALGQIVNRRYSAVASAPTGVASSPTRSSALRQEIRRQWQDLTQARHRTLLVADFYDPDTTERRTGACKRLAYYYPEALEPLALEWLKHPEYDLAAARQFVGCKLYPAADAGERRRLFDVYVAEHGMAARDGILLILFAQLKELESDQKAMSAPPSVAPLIWPRPALVELYGYRKTVKSEDGPYIHEQSFEEWSSQIASGLTFDNRERIDRACLAYLTDEAKSDVAAACLPRLIGRGYDDVVERYCRRQLQILGEDSSFYAGFLGKLGWTPLHVAVQRGDPDLLRSGLARGLRPDADDRFGRTALHAAAAAGHTELVRILLDAGATVDAKDLVGRTPAQLASEEDQADVVRLLAGRGCAVTDAFLAASVDDAARLERFLRADKSDLEHANKFGRTPLFLAAREGSRKAVGVLLRAGADANAADEDGWTPLLVAAAGGHEAIVAALLKNNAKPNCRVGGDGLDPLSLAAAAGNAAVARLLLAYKADPEAEEGKTERRPLHLAVLAGSAPTVRVLLDGGASVNEPEKSGSTPLHHAIEAGRADLVRLLLDRGADVETPPTDERCRPLHLAARQGNREIVELLLARHADVNSQTKEANATPLHEAARAGHADVARTLLEHGAAVDALENVTLSVDDPSQPGEIGAQTAAWAQEHAPARVGPGKGMSPLHTASRYGRTEVVRVLLDHKANPDAAVTETGATALHLAAANGHAGVVELLLCRGAKVDALNRGGGTPLHLALFRKRLGVAELLLSHKANPLACDGGGYTALHYAAWTGDATVVRHLIDRGADVHARTKEDGYTPLHWAATAANPGAAALLLDRGASVHATAAAGQTPLHFAAYQGRAGTVVLLLARKADPNARTRDGATPLHSAVVTLFTDAATVERLLAGGADPSAKDEQGKSAFDYAKEFEDAEVIEILWQALARRN